MPEQTGPECREIKIAAYRVQVAAADAAWDNSNKDATAAAAYVQAITNAINALTDEETGLPSCPDS